MDFGALILNKVWISVCLRYRV